MFGAIYKLCQQLIIKYPQTKIKIGQLHLDYFAILAFTNQWRPLINIRIYDDMLYMVSWCSDSQGLDLANPKNTEKAIADFLDNYIKDCVHKL